MLGSLDFTCSLSTGLPCIFFLQHSLALQLKILFTLNPQLSPLGAYLFEACLIGGVGGGGLFDLAILKKMMVSVLYQLKQQRHVEKLKCMRFG